MQTRYKPEEIQTIGLIDTLRIAAISPFLIFTPEMVNRGIFRCGLRWRRYVIKSLFQPYIYTVTQLSRYDKSAGYEKKIEECEASFQNNQHPYSYLSAAKFVQQVINSYNSISQYIDHFNEPTLRISAVECAFDIFDSVPTLAQLINFVSCGKGAGKRFLEICYGSEEKYIYDKHTGQWHDKYGTPRYISEQEFRTQIDKWNWCVYTGTRNYRITIYKKDYRIRHEVRYNRAAAVKKAFGQSRHVSVLQNRSAVGNIFRETAKRIYTIYQVAEMREVKKAIRRALRTFPRKNQKHEPRVLGCVAFYIDGRAASFFRINKVYMYIAIYMRLTVVSQDESKRIRAPPVVVPPLYHNLYVVPISLNMLGYCCRIPIVRESETSNAFRTGLQFSIYLPF